MSPQENLERAITAFWSQVSIPNVSFRSVLFKNLNLIDQPFTHKNRFAGASFVFFIITCFIIMYIPNINVKVKHYFMKGISSGYS